MRVNIDRAKLLDRLRTNREGHRNKFLVAQKGYRKEVIDLLDKTLADDRYGRRIKFFRFPQEPVDYTSTYDTHIGMLEVCTDQDISVSSDDFKRLFLDEWEWKRDWTVSNSKYFAEEG